MKFIKEQFNYYIKSDRFKFIVGIMIIFSLFITMYVTTEYSYINSILYTFTDTIVLIFIISTFLMNTINTINLFDKNEEYIIRYKTKKTYLKNLLKRILINNFFLFFIQIVLLILLLIVFNRNGIIIDKIGGYSVTNLTYTIFYVLRTFVIIQIFSIISALLYKIGLKIVMWLFNIGIFLCIITVPIRQDYIIDSYSKAFINPGEYLQVQQYKNFGFELEISFLYIIGWIIITYIIYLISIKKVKQIGGQK